MIPLLFALAAVAALCPLAVAAVRFARRQRGAAALATSLLLVFGISMEITPPPPPVAELVHRQAQGDEDGEGPDAPP